MGYKRVFLAQVFVFSALMVSGCRSDPDPATSPVPEYTRAGDWSGWRAKVATLNIWALPFVAKYIDERVSRVGPELRERQLDFAFIQEGWRELDRDLIARSSKFRHSTYFEAPRTIGSGLFNLSSVPLARESFREFALNGNLGEVWEGDAFAGKGVGMTTLRLRDLPVSMFNTHAIARYNGNGDQVSDPHTIDRLLQMFEIFRHIVEQTDSDAFVVAGDFNMRHFQAEYLFWRELTSLDGIRAEEADARACTSCEDNSFNDHGEGQLDYIFVSPRLRIESFARDFDQPFRAEDGQTINLSDHYGWTSRLSVAPASSSLPGADEAQVRTRTTASVSWLRARLEAYLPQAKEEQRRGIEERLCRSCRVEEAIEVLKIYESALDLAHAPRGNQEETVRTRLNSYFGFFRGSKISPSNPM